MTQVSRFAGNFTGTLIVGILCLLSTDGVVWASEIYKSIDANGNVVYSDHVDSSMQRSTVVQLEDPRFPPHELHVCWTNCFTLILDNGLYGRVDGTDENWTVETFSAEAVVLHRHDAPADWNGYSKDVVYAGQVANDRLISVTVDGKPMTGIDASWGSALNTLPGSNAERDGKKSANADPSVAGLSSSVAPPPLTDEEQPPLPQDGLVWTPGYWSLRDQRYVWIHGDWLQPPRVGVLWTPGYWSSAGTVFIFHPGYWGSTVGFYGGGNYGNGYYGHGYVGGHWIGNSFAYNSSVNHLNAAVAHTYSQSVTDQSSRSSAVYATGSRNNSTHPQLRPTLVQVADKPATTTTVQRSGEKSPASAPVSRPQAAVKVPAKSTPQRNNHVVLTK